MFDQSSACEAPPNSKACILTGSQDPMKPRISETLILYAEFSFIDFWKTLLFLGAFNGDGVGASVENSRRGIR